jgi:hypothetical protein
MFTENDPVLPAQCSELPEEQTPRERHDCLRGERVGRELINLEDAVSGNTQQPKYRSVFVHCKAQEMPPRETRRIGEFRL